jgi:outer membrane lipoprotein carrier protein
MKSFVKIMTTVLFLSFFAATVCASGPDENIAKIQKAYEGIRDLKGSFVQKSVIKDLDRTETYRGEFFIKRPMKMKWLYTGKTAQDLIINGDTVLIYKRGDKQAYKSRFDRQTYGQTPVALLSGFGNVKEEFDVSGKGDTLVLKPKKPMGNVTTIKVVLSDNGFPIRSFVINDTRGNVIEIALKDVKINTGLKDSLFDQALPKGVNVFEQ